MLFHIVCYAGSWRFPGSAQLPLQPQDTTVTLDSCLMDFWHYFYGGGGALYATCNRWRDTFLPCACLCSTHFTFMPQRQLCPCMDNPSLSVEQGPGSSGAPGVHAEQLSPCHDVTHRWLVSFLPHKSRFHLSASQGQSCLIPDPCAGLLIAQTQCLLSAVLMW